MLSALSEYNLVEEIVVTHDGVEALNYMYHRGEYSSLPEGNPVFILLDLKMPKVDGIQVRKQLKSDEKLSCIPVVILTSSQEPRDIDECYKHGANAYVVKPVQFKEFHDVVKEIGEFWAFVNEPLPHNLSMNKNEHH
jgi:CheY-like chemotaxis protein